MKAQKPEAALQRLILDWLAANRIWHERRNTGAMVSSYGGKKRLTKFSRPGTADIMATKIFYRGVDPKGNWCAYDELKLVWIEVKAPKGKQSESQQAFQESVEAAGHIYILAYSLEDVVEAFK